MKSRVEFHEKLVEVFGSENVHFQPPEGIKFKQGNRIIYERDDLPTQQADNIKYIGHSRYTVTLVTKDPDLPLITELPFLFDYCSMDRQFSSDGMNHVVYTIYY